MPKHSSISQGAFLKVAQVFNWASKEHYLLWFTGARQRSRRIEILLKRMTDQGKLVSVGYGKKLIYIAPRYRQSGYFYQVEHGLGVTEGLVRFIISDRSGVIIPERKFRGFGVRPEFGIVYKEGILLYEFCTRDNARRMNVLRIKLINYAKFVDKHTVVFVMDLPRDDVRSIVRKLRPQGPYLFTDHDTFLSVPLGQQLIIPIYIWEDGNEYPLRSS